MSTGSRNYTGEDALQLLQDLGLKQQAAMYPKVHDLTYPLPKLDMRVHCLHGSGVDTAEHFTYDVPRFSDSAPPAPSHVRQGPGDGTVNLRSLEAGRRLGSRVNM
ncbi:g5212 [Coccomyxa viridis]|uniref:G5212 protein n=1 Tax=Coccomyxa viridis TaxID=1274662 RepID=A0ABP1FS94_9CHLO